MAAYLIARVDIADRDRYAEYLRHTPRIMAEHGGRFLVRTGEVETVEGPAEDRRIVIAEFPTVEDARSFYASVNYQQAKTLRDGAGDAQFIIVDGYAPEEWAEALAASSALSFDSSPM